MVFRFQEIKPVKVSISGSITCCKFVQILEGRKHTLNKEMVPDDTDRTEVKQFSIKSEPENPLQQFDNDIPLDKCLCVEILSNWLNFSDENDHLNLLGKLKAYESKLSAGKCPITIYIKHLVSLFNITMNDSYLKKTTTTKNIIYRHIFLIRYKAKE
jgi:hypothetical protein